MTEKHHRINDIELPSTDINCKAFYGTVFDWRFTDWGPDYVSFQGAGIGGGFHKHDSFVPQTPGALVVLYSDDLATTQLKIEAAGGKILIPLFEFPGGRRFRFSDSCGNQLAVWSV